MMMLVHQYGNYFVSSFFLALKNETTMKFEYAYIIVELDYPHRGNKTIVVKNNLA